MSGRGLLARIASKRHGEPLDDVDSIVEHLRVLLNTRQGESATVPDFGISDFSEIVHAFPEGITLLQRSIRATVLQYEPRLRNVTVRHVRDEIEVLTLKFEITAQLASGARGVLRFRTQLNPGGRIDVR